MRKALTSPLQKQDQLVARIKSVISFRGSYTSQCSFLNGCEDGQTGWDGFVDEANLTCIPGSQKISLFGLTSANSYRGGSKTLGR